MGNLTKVSKLSWLFVLFIALLTVVPLIKPGFYPMQDDMQAFRIQQMDKCFRDGQIPCRWISDGGYQYGYPQFNYYSPGVYYLGEAIHLLGFQFIDVVKILLVLGAVVSSLAFFILIRSLWGTWPALTGAALYTYLPVKAVEIYVRGSLSEFWSFSFFPFVFWASYQLVKTSKLRYFAWLAFFLGGLFLTHNLMSFLFLPFFFLWSGYWLWREERWATGYQLLAALILGLGTASFFLLPMLYERQFVHIESMLGGYFDYRQHFVSLKQLFLSNFFGYGSSEFGLNDGISLSTGIPQWIAAVAALVLAVLMRKKHPFLTVLALTLAAAEAIVLFLIHQKSSFVWQMLPFLAWLQFPWRLLTYSSFLLSILGSLLIYLAKEAKFKGLGTILSLLIILAVLFTYSSFFQPKDWYWISDRDKFEGSSWEKQLTASIYDYLPIYAVLPPNKQAPAIPEVLNGQVEFISYQKGSSFQKGEVEVFKNATIRLPLFDFPGMKVLVDKKEVTHNHSNCSLQEYCFGLISFDLNQGRHIIEARLEDTGIRKIGNIISILSLCLLGIMFLKAYGYQKFLKR